MKKLLLMVAGLSCGAGLLLASGINREQVRAWQEKGAVVIDVRTPEEYQSGHLTGSTNVPLAEIEGRIAKVAPDKSKPILLHCQSGGRSSRAEALLEKQGYTEVHNLGGYKDAQKLLADKKN
jgi:phage shock protein E